MDLDIDKEKFIAIAKEQARFADDALRSAAAMGLLDAGEVEETIQKQKDLEAEFDANEVLGKQHEDAGCKNMNWNLERVADPNGGIIDAEGNEFRMCWVLTCDPDCKVRIDNG